MSIPLRSRLVTAGLAAFLLLACTGLGMIFGSSPSGSSPYGGGTGGAMSSSSTVINPPKVVVRAEGSAAVGTGTLVTVGLNGSVGPSKQISIQIPVPLAGLQVVFTRITEPPIGGAIAPINRGSAPFYVVFTNSSGLGQTYMPEGNYSVVANGVDSNGAAFNFTATVQMRSSTTTYLDLRLESEQLNVTSMRVNNPDGGTGVEPDATVFVELEGTFNYSPESSYQVIGSFRGGEGTVHSMVYINIQIVGSYPSPQGAWVVGRPTAPLPTVPSSNLMFLQYTANSTVTYIKNANSAEIPVGP